MHRVKNIQAVQKVCSEKSPSPLLLLIPLHRSTTTRDFVCTLRGLFSIHKDKIDRQLRAGIVSHIFQTNRNIRQALYSTSIIFASMIDLGIGVL